MSPRHPTPRAPLLPAQDRCSRPRAGAASPESSGVLQSTVSALVPATCHSLGRPAQERCPHGHLPSASHPCRERHPYRQPASFSGGPGHLPSPTSALPGNAVLGHGWERHPQVTRRPLGRGPEQRSSRPPLSLQVTGGNAFCPRAALPPWHRAAGLPRGRQLPHGLRGRSPHEIVPEVLAPDIVHRFAHQRSSHGRAVRSEAAIRADNTGVHPALGAFTGRPPHDTRICLTAAQSSANENALG